MRTSALPAAVLSLGLGLALWSAAAWAAGGRELWDVPAFWKMAWPAAILLCGVLGLAFPERPWRWAALLFAALPVVLLAAGSGFGLLPLGLVLVAALALPGVALAAAGGALARRRG